MTNIDEIVPEYFRERFKAYRQLKSDEEREAYWKNERATVDKVREREEWIKGLQMLRKAVKDMLDEVRAAHQT